MELVDLENRPLIRFYMDHATRLKIISTAWGKQTGYCFFPWVDGKASTREERIASYHEGLAFEWPADREQILAHLDEHWDDDLYWCPSLFEYPKRRLELAMDEHALWADLDEVDPREIKDYPPSVAWETSPGRYQALWLMSPGYDIQGASWRGGENHRLTVHLSADPGGWDTTQLLRLPEWPNHKPIHVSESETGEPPVGRLLWGPRDRRRYLPDEFEDLPDLELDAPMQDVVEEQIASINRREIWSKVRLKVSKEVRELVASRSTTGDRSERLWQIERDLADAGCNVAEIVCIVRPTAWNKYLGRADEVHRLVVEAAKAVQARSPEKDRQLEAEREELPTPTRLSVALRNVKPPKWLVREIWTEGGCGFIAGQPKSFKSWFAFDLGLSVATGAPFLGHDRFKVERPGKVLMVQEEDSLPTLKARYDKLWAGKQSDHMVLQDGGGVVWIPATEMVEPNLDVLVREGLTLSDPIWHTWLDEQLEENEYRMVLLDPLSLLAGDIDEFKSADVNSKIFRPLLELSKKHSTAICLVHHMRKGGGDSTASAMRGGQRMLGSTAYHAWAHDALYINLDGRGVEVQRENKEAPLAAFRVTGLTGSRRWEPKVGPMKDIFGDEPDKILPAGGNGKGRVDTAQLRGKAGRRSRVLDCFEALGRGPLTTLQIRKWCEADGKPISQAGVWQQMKRLQEREAVVRVSGEGGGWCLMI